MVALHPSRLSWQNPRVLTTLLLIFLCGAISGIAVSRISTSNAIRKAAGPAWKEGGREIALQRFRRELDLTPEQSQEFETVLNDFVMYYQTLQAQMDEVRANGKTRLMRVLSEDQRKKFEKMLSDFQTKQLR